MLALRTRSRAEAAHDSRVAPRRLPSGRILVLAAALLAVAACRGGARAAPAGPAASAAVVKLAPVAVNTIEDASEYVASIQSLSSTELKPEVSGEITKILVRSGDRVRAGQPLFVIDPRRQEASVTTQDAALAAQKAAATYAAQQLERAKMLLAAGAISQQELEQAQANADSTQSQLAAQQARLAQERVTLQYYQVRAPADGMVGDVPVRLGLHVTPDTVLTSVDRNQDLEVDVPIPLERAPHLRPGLPLEIFDGSGEPLARTQVDFVSPRVDEATQSVLVKGRITGGGRLRSSQFVRARIVWRTTQGITIPVLSVLRINGQPFVFVAREKDGRLFAQQRLIRVGPILGNDITVHEGLRPGEQLIVSGVQKLADGVPIRPE